MTHRNNKRNNRRNRQRNNKTELSPFASMLFGALLGKGTEMIAEKMAEAKRLLMFMQKELPTRTSTISTTAMQPYLSCVFLLMVRQLSTLSLMVFLSSSLRMVS